MIVVCLRSKYGYCKHNQVCDKVHFTDICESPTCTGEKCDKRHPVTCYYYDNFGMCKFGEYCSYYHAKEEIDEKVDDKESELKEKLSMENEIIKLKSEIKTLESTVKELSFQLKSMERSETYKKADKHLDEKETQTEDTATEFKINAAEKTVIEEDTDQKTSNADETLVENKSTEKEDNVDEKSLDEIIRENSMLKCDKCDKIFDNRKKLKKHQLKSHSRIPPRERDNYTLYVGEGSTGDLPCSICNFKTKEESEMIEHQSKEHDLVLGLDFKLDDKFRLGKLIK